VTKVHNIRGIIKYVVLWSGNLKERDGLEDPGVNRIILKWILNK
jgi:hypothetical protein